MSVPCPRSNPRRCSAALVAAVAASLLSAAAWSEDYPAWADTETERQGYDIAAASDRSDNGFGDSRAVARMVLRNAAGQETTRDMEFTTLERENEDVGDKSLVVFSSPRDVAGTALLNHAQIIESDDQWLLLPAQGRVKRLSSANKSGPFVGSEFAFEDFTALELNKYEYNYLGEDTIEVGGETLTVDVMERFPRYENSGYTRQISYFDQDIHQIRRVVFFNRGGVEQKVLDLLDYREYGDGVWRAHTLSMTNSLNRKATDIIYDDYEFSAGLTDRDFDKSVLNRIR